MRSVAISLQPKDRYSKNALANGLGFSYRLISGFGRINLPKVRTLPAHGLLTAKRAWILHLEGMPASSLSSQPELVQHRLANRQMPIAGRYLNELTHSTEEWSQSAVLFCAHLLGRFAI
jgi:hypothetical protein